jgi:outer membrane protein assembly factor BamA
VDIDLAIDAGQQYRVKEIEINGAHVFSPAELRIEIQLHPGEIADMTRFGSGLGTMRSMYQQKGKDANILPAYLLDDTDKEVTFTIEVQEK